jgi:hypothetical protein
MGFSVVSFNRYVSTGLTQPEWLAETQKPLKQRLLN